MARSSQSPSFVKNSHPLVLALSLGVIGACVGAPSSDEPNSSDDPETDDVGAKVTPGKYTVGGTASGLVGPVLIARINGADTLVVQGNGGFTFSTLLATGAP